METDVSDEDPVAGLGISYQFEEQRPDIHDWFGLTYAAYLCINRSLLQSMPDRWQHEFVALLGELNDHFPDVHEPRYTVYCRDSEGRFIRDPIPHYSRGRTLITPADEYGTATE